MLRDIGFSSVPARSRGSKDGLGALLRFSGNSFCAFSTVFPVREAEGWHGASLCSSQLVCQGEEKTSPSLLQYIQYVCSMWKSQERCLTQFALLVVYLVAITMSRSMEYIPKSTGYCEFQPHLSYPEWVMSKE